jgi:hypothetical protein
MELDDLADSKTGRAIAFSTLQSGWQLIAAGFLTGQGVLE